ncbi:hypothetical protein BN136_3470 [Cronobacter universalis NCTC 9529]|nr:hypothetical protein BN136_3470 [Cronobacter universalis NCTC 9529]
MTPTDQKQETVRVMCDSAGQPVIMRRSVWRLYAFIRRLTELFTAFVT